MSIAYLHYYDRETDGLIEDVYELEVSDGGKLTVSSYGLSKYYDAGDYITAYIEDENGDIYDPGDRLTVDGDIEIYYYYEDPKSSSWREYDTGTDYVEFRLSLPVSANKNNYKLIEVIDVDSGDIWDFSGNDIGRYVTIDGLDPDTAYSFRCRVTLPYGNTYYVGGDGSKGDAQIVEAETLSNTVSGTIYWRDRCNGNSSLGSYPVASARLDSTMNLTSSTYGYPNTGSKYIVARITDDNDEEYSPTEAAKFKPYANFKVYIDYEDVTKATWSCAPGFTSLEWSVTLPLAFTPSNYDLMEIVGSSTSSLKDIDPSSSNGKTITIGLGVDGDSQTLTPGTTYTIGCRITVPYGNQYYVGGGKGSFTTGKIDDDTLVEGCTARWYNYAAGNTGDWSYNTISIKITMGDYDYSSKYFTEAGLVHTGLYDFTKPSSTSPRSDLIKDTDIPTTTGKSSVTLSQSGLEYGSTADYTVYLKTINGTYMPIPASIPKDSSNEYEMIGATKPDNVAYTSGHEPASGEEVSLLASDINKFIHAMDRTHLWMFDEMSMGQEDVATGDPIYASTYAMFYDSLERVKDDKSFTNSFSTVTKGSPIEAANLIFLKNSINNMLGVL